jgi:hypothetical protein
MTQDNYFGRKVAAEVLAIFDDNSVAPKSGGKAGADLGSQSRSRR